MNRLSAPVLAVLLLSVAFLAFPASGGSSLPAPLFTLRVILSGNGSGTVTSTGGSIPGSTIDCGPGAAVCAVAVTLDDRLTLTATPTEGSSFGGWSGAGIGETFAGCPGTGTCTVVINSDKTVTAMFSLIPETLSVTKSGSGVGTVTSNPAGIDCGATCSQVFTYGTSLVLTASPGRSSTFKGWSGACSGTGTCSLTIKQAESAAARFEPLPACVVPNVQGKSLAAAQRGIRQAHCRTGRVTRRCSTLKRGLVVSQQPRAKRRLPNASRINLVISSGRRS